MRGQNNGKASPWSRTSTQKPGGAGSSSGLSTQG